MSAVGHPYRDPGRVRGDLGIEVRVRVIEALITV
jgi:hypothetical protein